MKIASTAKLFKIVCLYTRIVRHNNVHTGMLSTESHSHL